MSNELTRGDKKMHDNTQEVTNIILDAAKRAREETSNEPEPEFKREVQWPIQCTVGPGLEGAIASESKVGYVNGAKGWLVYRGYDIFDLCAYSTFEEVSYLLMHGDLPTSKELEEYKQKLSSYHFLNKTLRLLLSFPAEQMNTMASLRMGTNLMRQEFTYMDFAEGRPAIDDAISSDEDSIPMETVPRGETHAIYEFISKKNKKVKRAKMNLEDASGLEACYHLIAGVSTLTAAITRIRMGRMPVEPHPELSHAANLLYMMKGTIPTPLEERIMDVNLILHADHGMNASTFASMVVASTLADIYFSIGSGIAALQGPLHGGANEKVLHTINEIGSVEAVHDWIQEALKNKRKISGFGHRVYKAYDPRARILGPLAEFLVSRNPEAQTLYNIAVTLEKEVLNTFGEEKKIFPNVDFYSGIVYSCLGIPLEMFTPMFAVSRVAGWTARVLEYLKNNRIFRPRAIYTGAFNRNYVPLSER
jgi:citrate synthase